MTNISFRALGFAAASVLAIALAAPASAAPIAGSQANAVDNYYGNSDVTFARSQARSTVRQGTTAQSQAEDQTDTNGLHNW